MKHAAVCIIEFNGMILFLQRPVINSWCLPGGKVDETDASYKHAAARETLEETTIDVRELELVEVGSIPSAIGEFMVHVFYCKLISEPNVVKICAEHTGYMWVKTDIDWDAPGFDMAGNTSGMIQMFLNKK